MVTEFRYECSICKKTEWVAEIPDMCPDCENPDVNKTGTRRRDESNGRCSVGAPEDSDVDVNCNLIAMYEADIESDYEEDGKNTRKICEKHKKLWEGSKYVLEIREL